MLLVPIPITSHHQLVLRIHTQLWQTKAEREDRLARRLISQEKELFHANFGAEAQSGINRLQQGLNHQPDIGLREILHNLFHQIASVLAVTTN